MRVGGVGFYGDFFFAGSLLPAQVLFRVQIRLHFIVQGQVWPVVISPPHVVVDYLSPGLSRAIRRLFTIIIVYNGLFILPDLPAGFIGMGRIFAGRFPVPFIPSAFARVDLTRRNH